MKPEDRLPPSILEEAEKIGIRTLGVPEEYGGVELEKGTEVKTFALVAEEIARGDSGLADKMVQNWKVSVLLRQFAPKHLQEKWFTRPRQRAAIPDGALPDRAARRIRPLAALQRAGSRDADEGREGRRRLGDQRSQAVHLERLRREPLCRLCEHQPESRHAAGHVVVPRAARHQGLFGRALQRDARLPLHEQRRDGVRGHVRSRRSSARAGFAPWARPACISAPARSSRRRRISASACAPSRRPRNTCRTTCRAAAS